MTSPSSSRPANEGGAAASDLNDPRRVPVESAPATAHAIPPPATGDWPNDAGRVVDSAGNAIESATTEPPAKQGETPEYQPVAPGDFGAASWSELRDTLHSLRESLHEAKTELAGIKAAANCDLPGNEDCETVVRAMYHENRDLRARVAQLEQRILDDNKAYGCELRDPSGTIWEHAANLEKRLAQLEAAAEEGKKDSRRLTWLQDGHNTLAWNSRAGQFTVQECQQVVGNIGRGSTVRAAIDSAMSPSPAAGTPKP